MKSNGLLVIGLALAAGIGIGISLVPKKELMPLALSDAVAPPSRAGLVTSSSVSENGSRRLLSTAWESLRATVTQASVISLEVMLQELRSASAPIDRLTAMLVLEQMAKRDPKMGTEQALMFSDPVFKQDLLEMALFSWGSTKPEEAAAWLEEQSMAPNAKNASSMALLNGWLKKDPHAAAAFVAAQETTSGNWSGITLVGEALGSADPEFGKQWIEQLAQWQKGLAIEAVAAGIVKQDAAAAARDAASAPRSALQTAILKKAIASYTTKDPSGVAQLINGLPAAQKKEASEIALQSASKDVQQFQAITMALGVQSGSSEVNGVILKNLYYADATAATRWVNSLPPDAMTSETITTVANHFSRTDLLKTVQWLASLSNAKLRDTAIAEVAYRTIERDPTISQRALQAITDPAFRVVTEKRINMRPKLND